MRAFNQYPHPICETVILGGPIDLKLASGDKDDLGFAVTATGERRS